MCHYLFKTARKSLIKKPNFIIDIATSIGLTLGALLCAFTLSHLLRIKPLLYKASGKLFVVAHYADMTSIQLKRLDGKIIKDNSLKVAV